MTENHNRRNYAKRNHPLTNLMKNTILKIEQEGNRQNFIDKILNQYNGNKKKTPQKFHGKLRKSPPNLKKIDKGPSDQDNKKNLQEIIERQRLSVDNLKRVHRKISDKTNRQLEPTQQIIRSHSSKSQGQLSQDMLPLQSKISFQNQHTSNYRIIISHRGNYKNGEQITNMRRSQCHKIYEVQLKAQKINSADDSDQQQANKLKL